MKTAMIKALFLFLLVVGVPMVLGTSCDNDSGDSTDSSTGMIDIWNNTTFIIYHVFIFSHGSSDPGENLIGDDGEIPISGWGRFYVKAGTYDVIVSGDESGELDQCFAVEVLAEEKTDVNLPCD